MSAAKTSRSRAGPSSPPIHFKDSVAASRSRSATTSPNSVMGRPQAPQADAHLMQRLGPAVTHGRRVDDDLAQTVCAPRYGRLGAQLISGRDYDSFRLLGRLVAVIEKLEAALRLGLDAEREGHGLGESLGQREQRAPVARLELELQLADRRRLDASGDLALVHRQFDFRTLMGQLVRLTPKPCCESGGDSAARSSAVRSGSSAVPAAASRSSACVRSEHSHSSRSRNSPVPRAVLMVCT